MKYRTFGKLDWQPSALGFGAMRLPTTGNDKKQIDEQKATRMLRYAIDHGVNYVDTAYPYHEGESEPFLGRALQDGYREKVRLATKMPTWLIKQEEDYDRYLDEQLERLQTDRIDFYLLHAMNQQRWENLTSLHVFDWAEKALADGRIGYLGFSFHDEYEVFERIVDGYDGWTFCQVQYNFMDVDYQAGTKGVQYAADRGLAVVIMEPLRGGQLALKPPESVAEVWAQAAKKRTAVEWALQWLWNQPEISVVLSGMSTMQHVVDNVNSASRSGVGKLSEEELALVEQARKAYQDLSAIPCTGCGYCMPCPNGVDIPRIFRTYNSAMMYGDVERARWSYQWIDEAQRANMCVDCGQCQTQCPQGIEISEWLEKAHALLAKEEEAAG
ncbi:MAG: aldo/keto reductase, partial [Anaerolineales bacterium]